MAAICVGIKIIQVASSQNSSWSTITQHIQDKLVHQQNNTKFIVQKKKKKKRKQPNHICNQITNTILTDSMLGKNFKRQHFEIFLLFFPENIALIFYANRQFAWNFKQQFLVKHTVNILKFQTLFHTILA